MACEGSVGNGRNRIDLPLSCDSNILGQFGSPVEEKTGLRLCFKILKEMKVYVFSVVHKQGLRHEPWVCLVDAAKLFIKKTHDASERKKDTHRISLGDVVCPEVE